MDQSRYTVNIAEGLVGIIAARRWIVGQPRGVADGGADAQAKARGDIATLAAEHGTPLAPSTLSSATSNQPGDLRHWVHGDAENPS